MPDRATINTLVDLMSVVDSAHQAAGVTELWWRGQVNVRVLHSMAVAGEPIRAGAYPMPNKGVQATPYSVRCAPASGRA